MYIDVQNEVVMISTVLTGFREHISLYHDKVEHGETIVITRHGRPVAEVTPPASPGESKSWKRLKKYDS